MTLPYTWNPMPHIVSVKCPNCEKEANFEFAECVRMKLKTDVEYFQNSQFFEVMKIQDSNGHFHNYAFYFHKQKQNNLPSLEDMPENYTINDWAHSEYLYRSHGYDIGVLVCNHCQVQRKHNLIWPDDAFFKVEYRQNILWAFDRESGLELLDYIESKDRDRSRFKFRSFLMKVPSLFLDKKARSTISKKLAVILK